MAESRGATATPERGRKPAAAKKPNLFARMGLYYRQVVSELRKVVWPTRKELVTYTIVVVVFVSVLMGYVAVLDYGFGKLVLKIFG
ncbi:MAG TPA: preprotein translocase subunit SecE [Actinomycetes bacterium]|nr:preprotein translocase subunit SecE [Actinomycetes bacterium]